MRRHFPFALLLLVAAACAPAPAPEAPAPVDAATPASVAEARITADAAFEHIDYLAADEMRGRDTPSPELERAAEYLADRFEQMGLDGAGDDGGFIQRWPFQRVVLDQTASEVTARIGETERTWEYATEYFAIPTPGDPVEGAPLFVPDPSMVMDLPEEARGRPLLVFLPEGLGADFGLVIQSGMQHGATGIVLIMDEETAESDIHQISEALEAGAAGQLPFAVLGIRHDIGEALLRDAGIELASARDPPSVLENVQLSFRIAFDPAVDEVPNVVAKIRGSDPALADSYIVLTAHFDHVGVGPPDETGDSIYNGADDNASGTAALLKVAGAFADLPEPPARSLIFLAVSGEEKGLLGSQHYAQSPTVPLEEIVANLNMDMVGRNHPDTIYAIGEEYTTVGALIEEVAAEHPELGLVVAPDPEPEEQAFLRSDHYSFVQQGIPALMLTSWLHDDYHLPSDTVEKIDADKVARVARLTFLLAHRLASDPEAPSWTAEGEQLLQGLPSP